MPVTVVKAECDPFLIIDDTPKAMPEVGRVDVRGMYVKVQGGLCEFKRGGCVSVPPHSKPGRVIGQFSRASRLRLLKYLNTIDYSGVGQSTFITITYPDVIDSRKYADRGKHRYVFLRSLEKLLGEQFPTIWRIEWEVRKTGVCTGLLRPHYHLCCIATINLDNDAIRRLWGKAIGYKNNNLQVDIVPVTGFQGVLKYIAKYVSKIPTLDIPLHRNNEIRFGRHWGITRKHLVPRAPITVFRRLTEDEMLFAMKFADENLSYYDINLENGFTLLGDAEARYFEKVLNST